jgi:putative transposase
VKQGWRSRSASPQPTTTRSPSFFASLTKDLVRRQTLRSRAEARTAVFDYIETFYNPLRLHSTLDYLSPVDYQKMKEQEQQAA